MGGRIEREKKTVTAMIDLYCRALGHPRPGGGARPGGGSETQAGMRGNGGLCDECRALRDYALARLDRCRFADAKPTCRKCPVHCYRKDMRERIREVMRFSGPRMLSRHPVLAVRHLFDDLR